MIKEQKHIIKRQTLDLEYSDQSDTLALQEKLSKMVHGDFKTQFSSLLDQYAVNGNIVHIERLEVDLGDVRVEDFLDSFMEKAHVALSEVLDAPATTVTTQAKRSGALLIDYLKHGYVSWQFAKDYPDAAIKDVIKDLEQEQIATIKKHASTDARVRKRLVQLLPFSDIQQWYPGLSFSQKDQVHAFGVLGKFEKILSQKSVEHAAATIQLIWFEAWVKAGSSEAEFWKRLLSGLVFKRSRIPKMKRAQALLWLMNEIEKPSEITLSKKELKQLQNSFDKIPDGFKRVLELAKPILLKNSELGKLNHALIPADEPFDSILNVVSKDLTEDGQPASELLSNEAPTNNILAHKETTEPTNMNLQEKIFGPMAGLVIVHPFLSKLFENLGLLDVKKNVFHSPENHIQAVHVLAYLAIGDARYEEHQLVIPKLLAGYPLDQPIDLVSQLSEEAKTTCGELLQAIISHWPALGNSSPDAVREAFLQREGALEFQDGGWRLAVEKKSLDVLLQSLPWGIGVIKHPWMQHTIFVEWS